MEPVLPKLASRDFVLIFVAFLLVSISITGIVVHMVPLLTDRGVSARTAAAAVSLFGLSTSVGRVVGGYLLDRMFAPYLGTVTFLAAASGLALFWMGSGVGSVFAGAFLVGFGWGAEYDLLPYLVSRYFGMGEFGEMYGYSILSFTAGSMIGPYLMGLIYSQLGSYDVALIGYCTLIIVAVSLLLRLRRYPQLAARSQL